MYRGSDPNAASIEIGEVMRNLLDATASWQGDSQGQLEEYVDPLLLRA